MSHKRWLGIHCFAAMVAIAQLGCGNGGGHQTNNGGAGGAQAGGGAGGQGGSGGPIPDVSLIAAPATVTVQEGGPGVTFQVTLSQRWPTPITVAVAAADRTIATTQEDTLVFPANEIGPLTVTVLGTQDSDLINNTTVVTLTSPDAVAASVKVQVLDDDHQALLITPTVVSLTEGNQTQLGVRLAFAPTAPIMVMVASDTPAKLTAAPIGLTFNSGNYSTPQQVTLDALADGDTSDDSVKVTFTASDVDTLPLVVPVSIVDKDVLNINVQPASLSLDEGTMAPGTLMISLTQAPPAQLTVTLALSDDKKASLSLPAVAFTAANFSVPQAVTVTPKQDDDFKDENLMVTFSASGVTTRTASVFIKDDDNQAIIVNPTTVMVTEGSTATMTVRLAFNPGPVPVSVNAFSANTAKVTVSPSTLSFDANNFAVPQPLTIQGQQDDDLNDETTSVTLTSTGSNSVTAPVQEFDDDKQAIKLTYSTAPSVLTMQETQAGGVASTTQLGVSLAFRPATSVTVTLASSDVAKLTLSRTTLTFGPADFSIPQFITVTALHDENLVDDMVNIHLTGAGIPTPVDLGVEIIDLDVQNFVLGTVPDLMDEGTSATFTINLAFDAADTVNVNVTSSNATTPTMTNVLTATPAPNPCSLKLKADTCTVTLAAVADLTADNGTATITIADAAGAVRSRTAAIGIHDLDMQRLIVTPTDPIVVTENGPGRSFHVSLGAQPPGATGDPFTFTFGLSSTVADPRITLSYSPPLPLTVATAKAGVDVTVTGANDDLLHDVSATITISAPSALNLPPQFLAVTKLNEGGDVQRVVLTNPPCTTRMPPDPDAAALIFNGTPPSMGGFGPDAAALSIPEGSPTDMHFCVRLNGQPDQDTTMTLTPAQIPKAIAEADKNFLIATGSTPGAFTKSPSTLSFTTVNFLTPQDVWIHVPEDANQDDDVGTITISVTPFANPRKVFLRLPDNDRPQVTNIRLGTTLISNNTTRINLLEQPPAAPPTVASIDPVPAVNAVAQLDIFMKNPPLKVADSDTSTSEILTISATGCDATHLSITPTTLTFLDGNFATPQTLTLAAVVDDDIVDESCQITIHSNRQASGTPDRTLNVGINDEDTIDLIFTDSLGTDIVSATPSVSVDENTTSSFGIRFTSNPAGPGHSPTTATLTIGTFSTTPWSQLTSPPLSPIGPAGVSIPLDTTVTWPNIKFINYRSGGSNLCRANVVVPVVISNWGGTPRTLLINNSDAGGTSCATATP